MEFLPVGLFQVPISMTPLVVPCANIRPPAEIARLTATPAFEPGMVQLRPRYPGVPSAPGFPTMQPTVSMGSDELFAIGRTRWGLHC